MRLIDVIEDLHQLDREATIYVAEPWTGDSLAVVAYEPDGGGLPEAAKNQNLSYFLEIFIAQDVLQYWLPTQAQPPTLQERCARIIHYAVYDA